MSRWIGIDFSGDQKRWQEHHQNSNVWVATVEDDRRLSLIDLHRVQQLEGRDHPFTRLASLLQAGTYRAAAIDAPFSLPADKMPGGGHRALLEIVANIDHPGRAFPDGASLVLAVTGQNPPLVPPKPLRKTEQMWQAQGVPVRSTLWNGARPGAPMTVACLKLLSRTARPIWPWVGSDTPGVLVEAFPAAQLCHWGWPFTGYSEAVHIREEIIQGLEQERELVIPPGFRDQLLASADALDAVLVRQACHVTRR